MISTPSEHCDQTDQTPKARFLAILPPTIRGAAISLFLAEARAGVTDPADIVMNVLDALSKRIQAAEPGSPSILMLAAIRANLELAEGCAQAALEHDARPREEVLAEREHGRREGVTRWMEEQRPSAKQLAYIEGIGHQG